MDEIEMLRKKQAEINKLQVQWQASPSPGQKKKKKNPALKQQNFKRKLKLKTKSQEEIEKWKEENTPAKKPMQLNLFPDWQNGKAAMPNTIARSALFAPVARGRRRFVDNEQIASRQDITIHYEGKQFDMGDSDVFIQAIRLIDKYDLGTNVEILPYGFLREIGRTTGKSDKLWLDRAFDRLTKGSVTIETVTYKVTLHLIDEYIFNKRTETHTIRLNPKIVSLFKKEQYGLFDWEIRKQIKLDLTKWMQTYIKSNVGPQKIGLDKIQFMCGRQKRQRSKFKASLRKTFGELEALGLIKNGWKVENFVKYETVGSGQVAKNIGTSG